MILTESIGLSGVGNETLLSVFKIEEGVVVTSKHQPTSGLIDEKFCFGDPG